jgi:hypothetical protein
MNTMNEKTNSNLNIKKACEDLEKALRSFDDNPEAKLKIEEEAKRLKDLRKTIEDIKKQLAGF